MTNEEKMEAASRAPYTATHRLDMLKCVSACTRTTWLAATRGGAFTMIGAMVIDTNDADETALVRTRWAENGDEADCLFTVPLAALSPLASTLPAPAAEEAPESPAEASEAPEVPGDDESAS